MIATAASALLSHWRRKPLQLAMLLVGLSLATALWSAVQAINGEARASYARAASVIGQDRLQSLARVDGARFEETVFVALRRAGWQVSPVIEGERRFGDERVKIIGIDPLTLPPGADNVRPMETEGGLSAFVTPPGQLHVAPETARRIAGSNHPPMVTADTLPPGTAIADIGIAQALLGAESRLSRLLVWPDQPMGLKPIAEVAPELVLREPSTEGDLSRLTGSFHLNLTAFGFLSFAVGLFIVHAAIGLAFEQRRGVFRTLRALGLPVRSLMVLLVMELLGLALLAAAAGVALGLVIASALLPDVALSLRGLYGAELAGTLSVRPAVWLAAIAIAVAGTLGSAAQSLWQVWRMPLLEPARPRAWAMASERLIRLQAVAALLFLAASGAVMLVGRGLTSGFIGLGLMLLGAALLLPPIFSLLLRLGASLSRSALGQWFWADTRQQIPGLSLALMALMLALATNIGVGTMVSSFRLTFVGWLDQRLASELYITARNQTEADQIREWLAPRSDAVLPIWSTEGRVGGQPVQIFGIVDHATYRDKWPLLSAVPDVWDGIARGDGILVNEQLSRRLTLGLGSTIVLPGDHRLAVLGIYSDYGNPKGQVIIANDRLVAYYPDVARLRYAVRIAPEKARGLRDELLTRFDLPFENVIDQAEVKSFSLQIFDRTFTVTAALNVLTLGVAGVAMLSSLLTLSGMRLPQVAPVWAMGLTRRRLAMLEVLRSVALAAITMAAAIPVGLGLAWVLLAVINVEAFGWRLPLHVFPGEWLRLGIMALAAAGLAALIPAVQLARMAPSELLKVFAHER